MSIQKFIQCLCCSVVFVGIVIGASGCDKAKEFAENIENKVKGDGDNAKKDQTNQDNTTANNSSSSSSDSSSVPKKPVVPIKPKKMPAEVIADFLKKDSRYITDDHLKELGALESGLDTIIAVSLYRSKATEEGLAELKKLPNMEVLDVSESNLGDPAMDIICEMTQLRQLNVGTTGLTDGGLAKLATLEHLVALDISGNSAITGSGMAAFHDIPLRAFYASNTKFGQAGIEHLKSTMQLEIIGLRKAKVTDQTMKPLGQLKGVKQLDLSENGAGITDVGTPALGGIRELQYIGLMGCNIGDDTLKALVRCRQLKLVNVGATFVTVAEVRKLSEKIPGVLVADKGVAPTINADVLRFASTDPNVVNLGGSDALAATDPNSSTTSSSPPMPVLREWVDSTGTFKINAKFIKFEGGNVFLEKEDGSELTLSSGKLSKADQDWIREELARRK